MNPVIVKCRNHKFRGKFQEIAVCYDILQRFIPEGKPGCSRSFFATLHDFFGVLIDYFHFGWLPKNITTLWHYWLENKE